MSAAVTVAAVGIHRTRGLGTGAPRTARDAAAGGGRDRGSRSRLSRCFRYWEGGYAPPARYLVEVMPLAAPFLAYGLTVVRQWLAALLLGLGVLSTFVLAAIPTTGLNSAFEHKLREQVAVALGIDPLGWLPSFQPVTPDWFVGAYLRLIPAVLAAAVLVWLGRQRARA